MARPKKLGLDYFPFDVDFFDDDKIALIEGEFGIKGPLIAIKLLCAIYKNGYFYQWGEDECLLFCKKAGAVFVPKLVNEVVAGLVRRSFFDERVYNSFRILTSAGIQRRYMEVARKRSGLEIDPKIWLLDVSAGETGVFGAKTRVFDAESTQSKDNISPNGAILSSTTSTIAGGELSIFGGSAPNSTPKSPKSQKSCAKKGTETAAAADVTIPIEQLEAAMLAETVWIEALCMNLHKSRDWIDGMIHEFCTEQQLNGATVKPLSDAKRHFRNYLRKAEERTNNEKSDERTQWRRGAGKAPRTSDLDFAKAVAEGIALANTPQEWEL